MSRMPEAEQFDVDRSVLQSNEPEPDDRAPLIGRPVPRVEDARLLRGQTTYVSDLAAKAGAATVLILRSPHPHARIADIHTEVAARIEGVLAILTADELGGARDIPCDWAPETILNEAHHPVLARDRVLYAGQPVAAVVADTKYAAHDALDLIEIAYEPLPAIADQERAIEEGAPLLHGEKGNVAVRSLRSGGDFERAKAKADVVIVRRLTNNRLTPSSMEGRAAMSVFDPVTGELTHRSSSQLPHVHARALATCLDLPMSKLHFVSPDVGGGFGGKLGFYAEDVIVARAAMVTGRICAWVESRAEGMTATTHGRDHVQYAELTARRDGTITGVKATLIADLGAFAMGMGPGVPAFNAGAMVTGPYRIPNVISETLVVYTNRTPTGPYRGAGHPEATFLIERMVEELAVELGMDPAEVRRKNFVPASAMPYKMPTGFVLDSGDYAAALDAALEKADYAGLRRDQAEALAEGRHLGIGIACYSETSGAAPSMGMAAVGFRRAGHESARVVMHPDGRVTLFSGGHSHGQGHATSLAQIVADTLDVPLDDVEVVQGDAHAIPFGTGTYNSRTMAVGGTAAMKAARRIRAKLLAIAAHKLEAREKDVVLENGVFRVAAEGSIGRAVGRQVRRTQDQIKAAVFRHITGARLPKGARSKGSCSVADIAREAHLTHDSPLGMVPGLDETVFFDPKDMPASYATHIALVEVDPKLGHVGLLRHIIVDDCGRIINPLLATGQVHGGAAQGIGQALMEQAAYAADGSPLMGGFIGYAMPRATDLPDFETGHTTAPTKLNPLGAKGIGEGAAIGAPPAIVHAVLDSLRTFGVRDIEMPVSAERIVNTLRESKMQSGCSRPMIEWGGYRRAIAKE